MTKYVLAAAAAGLVLAFGGGASAQATFDCSRTTSTTGRLICSDPSLVAADKALDQAYRSALANAADGRSLRSSQENWVRDLNRCGADPFCIAETYADRIQVLSNFTSDIPSSKQIEVEPTGNAAEAALATTSPSQVESAETEPYGEMPAEVVDPAPPYIAGSDIDEAIPLDESQSPPPQTAGAMRSDTQSGLLGGGLLLGFFVAVLGALMGTKALAEHSMERYGWPMILNWWNVLHVAAVFAFYVGWMFAGPLAGAIVAAGLWLIVTFVNIRKTNLGLGLLISVVQPLVVWILYAVIAITRHKPTKYDYRT